MTKLEQIFNNNRIVALAGNKNSGKTNNIVYLIKEQLLSTPNLTICVYGFEYSVTKYLLSIGCTEISDLRHMVDKKNTLFIIDEMQKLKLNDRRNKDTLNKVVDFIYHNNNLLLLSSPNIREFNSVIGGIIEKWLLKSVNLNQCVNGSQLKKVIMEYKGRLKTIDDIRTAKNELLVINNHKEEIIYCDYVVAADNKKKLSSILSKNCQDNCQENVKELSETPLFINTWSPYD